MKGARAASLPNTVRWLTQMTLLAVGLGLTILAMQIARAEDRPSDGPGPSERATPPSSAAPEFAPPSPGLEDEGPPSWPESEERNVPPSELPEPPIVEPDGLDRVNGFWDSPGGPTGGCVDSV